jgi:primosomal protein N'
VPRTANVTASLFENPTDGPAPTVLRPPARQLFKDLILAGPVPAPLLRAETFYRYQIMLRVRAMSALSRELAALIQSRTLPEDITLTVDIDPVSLS